VQGSLRVDLSPKTVVAGSEGANLTAVIGGRLRLTSFGPQPETQPGPIEIVFSADYFTTARAGERCSVGEFAKLPCNLLLTDKGLMVQVTSDGALPLEELEEIPDQDHPSAGKLPPLSLSLELGEGFQSVPPTDEQQPDSTSETTTEQAARGEQVPRARLRVPPPPKACNFLEIAMSVKRDGTELAAASTNGRLDIPLRHLDYLVFHVESGEGEVVPDAAVEIITAGTEVFAGVTDEVGRFALNGVPVGECEVRLPGRSKLVSKLRVPVEG
jgi:hypothetical protein